MGSDMGFVGRKGGQHGRTTVAPARRAAGRKGGGTGTLRGWRWSLHAQPTTSETTERRGRSRSGSKPWRSSGTSIRLNTPCRMTGLSKGLHGRFQAYVFQHDKLVLRVEAGHVFCVFRRCSAWCFLCTGLQGLFRTFRRIATIGCSIR